MEIRRKAPVQTMTEPLPSFPVTYHEALADYLSHPI